MDSELETISWLWRSTLNVMKVLLIHMMLWALVCMMLQRLCDDVEFLGTSYDILSRNLFPQATCAAMAVSGWVTSISLWCLNPGVVFEEISSAARSIILTSGYVLNKMWKESSQPTFAVLHYWIMTSCWMLQYQWQIWISTMITFYREVQHAPLDMQTLR